MKIFVSKNGAQVHELKDVDELHISHWKNLVVTYLNFQTNPFAKCFLPNEWDTIIINKKDK
jgi:hypothetical protein